MTQRCFGFNPVSPGLGVVRPPPPLPSHTFRGMNAPEESKVPRSPSSSSVHHSGSPSRSSSMPSLPARRRPPPRPSESRKSKSNFLRRLSPRALWSRQPAERGPPSDGVRSKVPIVTSRPGETRTLRSDTHFVTPLDSSGRIMLNQVYSCVCFHFVLTNCIVNIYPL